MCGRYTLSITAEILLQHFGLDDLPSLTLTPRYNIAPSQLVPVIRMILDSSIRECAMLRWGLIPAWAKDPKTRLSTINAKAETEAVNP